MKEYTLQEDTGSKKDLVVNREQTKMTLDIANALTSGTEEIVIKCDRHNDALWRIISFLGYMHDLNTVTLQKTPDGMIITKNGDQR